MNKLPFLFCGIFFTIAGKFISIIPSKFKPIIVIIDANISIIIGEAKLVKALPVSAHIIPIILSTSERPIEKESICINNFLLLSFEYPPTYPIINGNIPRLQGDNEARIPAKKEITIITGIIILLPDEYKVNASIRLFIECILNLFF